MRMKAALIILAVIIVIVCGVLLVLSHPAFGLLRHRSTREIQSSPNWHNGMFQNQEPTPQFTGDVNMFSAMWNMLRGNNNVRRVPDRPLKVIKTDLRMLSTDRDWVVWFGHSSYLFCLDGKRYLVDPVLRQEFPSSLMMKPFKGTNIFSPNDLPDIDILIITHEHWDHMDYATLRDIRNKVKHVVCPIGIADYLRYWKYPEDQIAELDWYNHTHFYEGAVEITCLPSRHFSNRLLDRNQTLWASFMVESSRRQVYIGGDGGYDNRFKEIRATFGQVDLAFLENGQYNDNWKYTHTTPSDLEKVINDLQAKQVFTVHHDKYALAMHPWNEPDSVAASIAERDAICLLDAPIGKVVYF